MAELSSQLGLGSDSYWQYQKEVTFATPATGSEIFLPLKEGSGLKVYPEIIESNNAVPGRTGEEPNPGRLRRPGTWIMDGWPTRMGGWLEQFNGASSDAAVGDGAFVHTWLMPTTGARVGTSSTWHQALGSALADQVDGFIFNTLVIDQDSSGNLQLTSEGWGQGHIGDVARETAFSFPANATNPPFKFGMATITITNSSGSNTVLACADTINIALSTNHDPDYYKICSSASGGEIKQSVFMGNPTATLTLGGVDADKYFQDYARTYEKFDITISWLHTTSTAGSTPTYHRFDVELPGCRLSPETEIPFTKERMKMDLAFECKYGGTSTGSGTTVVMWELRLTDATAAYAG